MARALVRFLPLEMAVLGVFELALLYGFIFTMLTAGGPALLIESTNLSRDCLVLAGMLAVTIAGTAATIGLYRPDVCLNRRRLLVSATVSALFAFPAILLVSGAYHVTLGEQHVIWLARLLAVWLPFVLLIRFGFSLLATYMPVTRRVLIVGTGARAADLRRRLAASRHALFEPVVPPGGGPAAFGSKRKSRRGRIWGVVIAEDDPVAPSRLALLDNNLRGIPVYSDLYFHERHLGRIQLDAVDSGARLFAGGTRRGMLVHAIKRLFDIVVSLTLMVVTLPMMLVTAAAIKLDSPGPVFYRQIRTGLRGAPFTLYKFRSMANDAEVAGQPQWAQQRDPRVTRVGAFIRATRIDELPQLINVLGGAMSMIGPRPERPIFVEQLARAIPFYHHRCDVKPGLTGWAQVNFPYGASVEDAREKLAYDLYYVKHRGVMLDLLILLATVRVILFREGAR